MQAPENPNTAAKQTRIRNKIHSETGICTFSELCVETQLNASSPQTTQSGAVLNPKWASKILNISHIDFFFLNLTNPDKLHFGLARFDCIHIPPHWNVSALVKVTDKIRSKWALNELAFNNAKYAKLGLAF